MTTDSIGLFKALGAKMDFLNQRQRVISQNIANTDTPGYQPKDLKEVDFSKVLDGIAKNGGNNVKLATPGQGHMGPNDALNPSDPREQKKTYEIAPAGNAVIMEEQLINSGATVMDYNLMTNLYQKNMGLIRSALGNR